MYWPHAAHPMVKLRSYLFTTEYLKVVYTLAHQFQIISSLTYLLDRRVAHNERRPVVAWRSGANVVFARNRKQSRCTVMNRWTKWDKTANNDNNSGNGRRSGGRTRSREDDRKCFSGPSSSCRNRRADRTGGGPVRRGPIRSLLLKGFSRTLWAPAAAMGG